MCPYLARRLIVSTALVVAFLVTGTGTATATSSSPTTSCKATRAVLNHGRPLAWQRRWYKIFQSSPRRAPAIPEWVLRDACRHAGAPGAGLPGGLDYHQARSVSDPFDEKHRPLLIIPGKRGIALVSPSNSSVNYDTECAIRAGHGTFGFTFLGNSFANSATHFYGLADNTVTQVTASDGLGGSVVPAPEVSTRPRNNFFAITAPDGALHITYARTTGKPVVTNLVGTNAYRAACPTVPEDEGWTTAR